MPGGIFVHSSPMGSALEVRRGLMTAGQTFNKGAVVQVVAAGTVTVLPEDNSEVLVADVIATEGIVGVALNGPGAATSAAIPEDFVKFDSDTGAAYAATTWINFAPINRGILFRTSAIFATAGGATLEVAANITGADRGAGFFITYNNALTPDGGWGIERTAITAGWATEVYAKIVDVLDARGRSVPTAASLGTQYVFEICGSTFV